MLVYNFLTHFRFFSSLTIAAKVAFYKKLTLYKQCAIVPKAPLTQNFHGFLNLLLANRILPVLDEGFLRRAYVVVAAPLFIYVNAGKKYTTLSPKANFLYLKKLAQTLKKELLVLPYRFFMSFFDLTLLKKKIYFFLPKHVKQMHFLNNKVLNKGSFFWQKLIFNSLFFTYQYFFYRLFVPCLSKFQKKTKFLQFNIFFKKYTYTT